MGRDDRWREVIAFLMSHPTIDRAFTLYGTYAELIAFINGFARGREDKFLQEFKEWLLQNGAKPSNAPYCVLVLYGSGISLRSADQPLTDEQQVSAKRLLLTRLLEFVEFRNEQQTAMTAPSE